MKVLFTVEIVGKKDRAKVVKALDLSYIPFHNSVICFPDGPKKRLNEDISILAIGLNFRVNAKDVHFNPSYDACLIETVDETQFEVPLKILLKEYLDCGWSLVNESK